MNFGIQISCYPQTLDMQQMHKDDKQLFQINHLSEQLKRCFYLTREIEAHQFGFFFKWPVDPYQLKLDNYWTVIKKPMDLKTISCKLELQCYHTIDEFNHDMQLMFNNASTYHRQDTQLVDRIKDLKEFYQEGFRKVVQELEVYGPKSLSQKQRQRKSVSIDSGKGAVDRRSKILNKNEAILKTFFTKQRLMKLGRRLGNLNQNKKKWFVRQLLRKYPHLVFSQNRFQLHQLSTMEIYDVLLMTSKFKKSDYDMAKMSGKSRLNVQKDVQIQEQKVVSVSEKKGLLDQEQQQSSFEIEDSD